MTTASGSLIDSAWPGGCSSPGSGEVGDFSIAVEEIEAALATSGLLVGAAVTVHEGSQGEKIVVAHVVPSAPADFRPAALQEHLLARLPGYPLPSRFVALDALPLDVHGNVDHKALLERHPQSGVFSTTAMIAATYDPLTAQLAAMWADVLGVAVVLPNDDFFALGGDSLQAARLVLRIRDVYRVPFPVRTLYEAGTLRACAAVVQRAQRGEDVCARSAAESAHWQADARLPPDVRAAIEAVAARTAAPPDAWRAGEVFLTGATGFLGSFLLRELLVSTTASVHCLVRADDPASGMVRVRQALARHGLWQEVFARRIHVVPGDLRWLRFGLDEASFEALAYMVDALFHCGAHVNYVEPYLCHRATNVGGTAEVLRLAATGLPKPLHHVSTLAVFGPSGFFGGEPRIHEDDDLDEHAHYLPFDVGYAASKWAAEKLAWEAARAGLPVTVYRPGLLLGDSRTGAGRADDFIGRVVRGAIQIGGYPDLPRQRCEFVPVDRVSRAIVHIAGQPSHHRRAHHLVPPDARPSTDLDDLFALVREFGYPLSRWSYRQWVERTIEDARARDNPLAPLLPMLSERVYKDELTRWELHENSPAHDASHALWALARSDIEFPAIDRTLVANYLRRWIAAGVLPPVRAVGRRTERRLAGT